MRSPPNLANVKEIAYKIPRKRSPSKSPNNRNKEKMRQNSSHAMRTAQPGAPRAIGSTPGGTHSQAGVTDARTGRPIVTPGAYPA